MDWETPATLLLQTFEGCKLVAYQDSVGVWTIGYGSTRGVRSGMIITQLEANQRLAVDMKEAAAIVDKYVTVPLNVFQKAALVSFVYNVGPGQEGAKDGFVWLKKGGHSTILRMINAKDFAGAAGQFSFWAKAGSQVLNGLVRRRKAEHDLFCRTDSLLPPFSP